MIAEVPEPIEFSRIRARLLSATYRAVADLVEMYPGITAEKDSYYAALEVIEKGAGCVLDADSGVTVLEAACLREALEVVPPAPPMKLGVAQHGYRSLADGAREMADGLREDADIVEEFPGIMNLGPGTRKFTDALYEAGRLRDGSTGDEIDADLAEDEDEGDEGDEGDETAALPVGRTHSPVWEIPGGAACIRGHEGGPWTVASGRARERARAGRSKTPERIFAAEIEAGVLPSLREVKRRAACGTPRAKDILAELQEVLASQSPTEVTRDAA